MNNIPTYSVVAFSGTGKTTLLEKLIPELKRNGLRVGVLKHDAHDFDVDREGKDSWRLTNAGADVTAIVSAEKAVIMENRPVPVESVFRKIDNVDILITEGYKHGAWPKIALYRSASGKPLALPPEECFAVMSDTPLDIGTPLFALDDIRGLAELILCDMREKQQKTAKDR
ncbi:MAG: molybdopterin-guanine dinucleotide biosynthesis protein B [Clostridiales bacterium]|jgi:molybdopterin-guanine dinucleotide biosynthesis protein MobB|nr:molybdopterin-guanine dinucleotide biosynthesis protein B [Clostridiales bacterium]